MLLFVVATLFGFVACQEEWKLELVDHWDDIDFESNFLNWQKKFGREYSTIEEASHRFDIFVENWNMIHNHNVKGTSSYRMRMNQFGDLTQTEVTKKMFGNEKGCILDRNENNNNNILKLNDYVPKSKYPKNVPESIDWTDINGVSYVTPVKNQADCGSCWAFSATGSLESRAAIATNTTGDKIIELSEQQLVDCTYSLPDGCSGGLQEDAFDYIAKEGGLCTETEYPYKGRDTECTASSCGTKYDKISGYKSVHKDNSTDLLLAIAEGPVAVSIDAAGSGWTYYSSGVYSKECGVELDHGVLGVGYGTDNGDQYWKIKNSWGTDWGIKGYILICRNCGKDGSMGECGILRDNTYPLVD